MENKYAFGEQLEQHLIIDKINELYITNRKTFLKLSREGKYSSVSYIPLHDGLIKNHLDGVHTIGVFSGKQVSKFICFDIDMVDKSKLKWVYYLLMKSLREIGLEDKYIHVSHSGNKGLHVLLFIQDGTSLTHFQQLFENIMMLIQEKIDTSIKTKLFNDNELKLDIDGICQIEFRPSFTQGVKLELGVNFKNKNNKTNKCWFVDKDTLKSIKKSNYILDIDPMPKDEFLEVMDTLNDTYAEEMKIEHNIGLIKEGITEPHSHKINKNENETIEYISNLIQNGLQMTGTRHNSTLKIAKYFRYMGLELEQCIEELQKWMRKQDKKYYSSTLEYALSESERISRIVYEKEYSLVGHVENLKIYKSEMEEIVQIENKNDKLLLYTMLIHSKRYALNNGVFYMTYKQIKEMCNIGIDGALKSIERLESVGLLNVISRDIKQGNTYIKKPNKYRINLNVELGEVVLEIDNSKVGINNNELYYHTVVSTFTNDQLKHLPTRQYKELTKYRNTMVG
jgi:hypothetical protein